MKLHHDSGTLYKNIKTIEYKSRALKKEFIAYAGQELTIEWYFTSRGKSESLLYFEELPVNRKKKVVNLIRLLGNSGKIFNKEKFRHEGNQIYAIKASEDRFLCFFFDGAKVIVTNAYEKKSAKMPQREKKKSLKAKDDYTKRVKRGTYYE